MKKLFLLIFLSLIFFKPVYGQNVVLECELDAHVKDYTKKNEWESFLNFWLFKDNNIMEIQKNLENFKKSSDKDLSNLVEIISNHYL